MSNTYRSRSAGRKPSAEAEQPADVPAVMAGPPVSGRFSPGNVQPQSPRRRRPIGSFLLITLGVLCVLISAGTYFAVSSTLTKITKAVPTANLLGTEAAAGSSIDGVLNILLIGVDTRPNNTIGSRSDSIIIMHIPASHDRAYLISIPRDTMANIPGHGTNKINAAFQIGSANGGGYAGGSQELAKTLAADYNLTFNAATIVNFSGFSDIVKALGGVTMYVDERTPSLHHGYIIVNGKRVIKKPFVTYNKGLTWHKVPGVTDVIYTKGTHHLSAYEALDYVRIRDGLPNGDYDRQRHQQQFIKAVLAEAVSKGLSNPFNAGTFISSISKAFVWGGGKQPLSNWIFTLKGISPSAMTTIKTNDGTYDSQRVGNQSYEILSPTSLELLNDVRTDNLDAFVAQNKSWVSST